MYGTTVHNTSVEGQQSRWKRSSVYLVPAIAITMVIAVVVLSQQAQPALELESTDSEVLRHEKEGIAAAQNTLNKLNKKAETEAALLKQHAVNGKKEAMLAKASKAKAEASRQVAAALLDTVKQHTEEIAKAKDLAQHDKEQAIAAKEETKAKDLRSRAAKVHADEIKAAAKAKKLSLKAIKDKTLLKQTQAEIDKDMAKVESDKLAAKDKEADASAEQHLSDLGVTSSKARKQRVEHLHNKIRRLSRRIAQIKRKYTADEDDFAEDTKAASEYRAEVDADRKARAAARADAHALKNKQADESRQADQQGRVLETAKEIVHTKDNELQHILSREHEAKTALRRAQDRLKNAERSIYHAQMKNEADRNPSDADLGLV